MQGGGGVSDTMGVDGTAHPKGAESTCVEKPGGVLAFGVTSERFEIAYALWRNRDYAVYSRGAASPGCTARPCHGDGRKRCVESQPKMCDRLHLAKVAATRVNESKLSSLSATKFNRGTSRRRPLSGKRQHSKEVVVVWGCDVERQWLIA